MDEVTPIAQTIPELRSAFDAHFTLARIEHLALFEQMVGINSFTLNVKGVNALAAYTAEVFAKLGFTTDYIQAKDPRYGKHLKLRRPGTTQHSIAMVSHLDTVFSPEEEIRNQFHWRVDGDRIYGPGVIDIKGGTIIMFMVLDALHTIVPKVFESISWTLLFNAAEEHLAEDFGPLCQSELTRRTLACLVFEPGISLSDLNSFALTTSRKGRAELTITANGRSSHSGGQHHRGANAILQIAEVIPRIEQITDYSRELTVNIGTIVGGESLNRVPSLTTAQLEIRAFSSDLLDEAVAKVLALDGFSSVKSPSDNFPCTISVTAGKLVPPWPDNPSTNSLFEVFEATARLLGIDLSAQASAGLSDGNRLWSFAPTIDGLGPIGQNAHCSEQSEDGSKEQEYVLASSLIPKATLLALTILKLVKAV